MGRHKSIMIYYYHSIITVANNRRAYQRAGHAGGGHLRPLTNTWLDHNRLKRTLSLPWCSDRATTNY